jgi:uncharacterized OB-fold protein
LKNTQTLPDARRAPHQGQPVGQADVRSADGELQLVGCRCRQCDARMFPANALCPFCLSEEVEPLPLSHAGKLYSFTFIHVAPPVWEVPYGIAYVDLPERVRVFGKLADADPTHWKLDQKVRLRVERVSPTDEPDPQYHYFFDGAETEG